MFSFTVSVHLDSLFDDERSRCKLYVSSEHIETAGDLLLKIRNTFKINDPIDLFIEDFESLYYIPPSEDARIFQSNNIVIVKRNCNADIESGEMFRKKKLKKRKRIMYAEYKNEGEAMNTSEIKEKKKKKAISKEYINNTSDNTTVNFEETINNNKNGQNDIKLSNNSSNESQNSGCSESHCSNVTHTETSEKNYLREQMSLCSTSTTNTEQIDSRKIYNPSYSSTTFKTLGTMATSHKHMFTERKPVQTLKISTVPKIIQSIKVVDNETLQFSKQIDNTNNISDYSSLDNTLEVLEDNLDAIIDNKESLELSQKVTEEEETNTTKDESSLTCINSTPILIDPFINNADIKETEKCDVDYFTANFVTKRKRRRHRKKKSNVNEQTQNYSKCTHQNKTPKPSIRSSAPLIHIKFDNNEDDDPHHGHQTNQDNEKGDTEFENEDYEVAELNLNKLEKYITNPPDIEQNTCANDTINYNTEKNNQIVKPSPGIKILDNIRICDPILTNSKNTDDKFAHLITNKSDNMFLPSLPNSQLNDTTKTTSYDKLKPKTTSKFKFKTGISPAMQRAINNYFKDLNVNGTLKEKAIEQSDSNSKTPEKNPSFNGVKSNGRDMKSKNCSNLEENTTAWNEKQLKDRLNLKESEKNTTQELFSPFSISESNILMKPLMSSKPTKDNIVAFKKVVLTENYTPEVSKFIIAKVLDFQTAENVVSFYVLDGSDQLTEPKGKFSLEEENAQEAGTKEIVCRWEDVLEPRLLYS